MSALEQAEAAPKTQRHSGDHPLLSLSPQARRQLARTLVQGLAITQAAERRTLGRAGVVGGAAYGALGALGFAAWHAATGGAAVPYLAFYATWGAVQAAFTAGLARQGLGLGPAPVAAVLDGPRAMLRASAAWILPQRFTPDRLVLAAGILIAARRPVSRRLLVRLYGRAFPQGEVDQAIELLARMAFVTVTEVASESREAGILALSPQGFQLLKGLGVTAGHARARKDPVVAPHILPLFAALDGKSRRLPAEPEPLLPQAPPTVELPFHAPVVLAPLPVAPLVEPLPAEPPVLEPTAEPEAEPETEPFLDPLADAPDDLPPYRPRRSWRRLARPAAAAAAAAFLGLLAYFYGGELNPLARHETLAAHAGNMPGPGRGVALQFNGRGKLLSSYGGGLYLSIPDRLDYKTPISFQNFDMAANCGLVSREVSRASLSPQGRFLWCEMGGDANTGPRERCLVDLETKTVTHDLVARDATYGLPGVVGWAGDQQLLMSDEAPPHQAAHWWLMDVATNQRSAVNLPEHSRLMPLATDTGMTMLAGWDLRQRGVWDLSVYRLDEQHAYQQVTHVHTTLPEGLREAEPRVAAVSADHRYLLATLRPVGMEMPAQDGSLAVIALDDGTATLVSTAVPPLPDQPVFWAPEAQGGHYRFFFNGGGPDGAVPCTGEVTPGQR